MNSINAAPKGKCAICGGVSMELVLVETPYIRAGTYVILAVCKKCMEINLWSVR